MQAVIEGAITLVLSNFTVTLFLLGLLTAGIGMLRARRRDGLTAAVVWEELLNHFLLLSVGVSYLYNFVMHSVFGDFTAEIIGWDQSPFQLEVAFASLGFAAVGFLAFPRRQGWVVKLAALLGPALFLWGAAAGHIYQIATAGNQAQGNAGSILYTDILLPLIGFVFLWGFVAASRRERQDAEVDRAVLEVAEA
ncbi:hypothetical protein K0817_002765 [Microbacterium sp. HD4P20]|uniref:DUF6790 family protein n=1 Tax=Microbacterium sp. HD4P20 TaxID=2864874 RepID=UPI001C642855|nr:DUF6790 family protein [Microbacterium sp. HD4P20]MCP2635486.1 hypothetical protein [Microbacterium sp. HD4P20]